MKTELSTQLRVAGLVRSPDHEGALAHLDAARGFALVVHGSASLTDVIDPAIWVKEKLSVAVAASSEAGEAPLRRLLGALRSIHGDLMRRAAQDRPSVSVLAALFQGGDGIMVSAGDCAAFRYRDGLLARLRRPGDESRAEVVGIEGGTARGSLGSEPQVKIEVVPLRPRPGDVYVASTRQLREGEIAALARNLGAARNGAELLRAGIEGGSDRGRWALRILEADEDATLVSLAERLDPLPAPPSSLSSDLFGQALDSHPLVPDRATQEANESREGPAIGSDLATFETIVAGLGAPEEAIVEPPVAEAAPVDAVERPVPSGIPPAVFGGPAAEPAESSASTEPPAAGPASEDAATEARPKRRELAPVEDGPAWYELLAIWGGGALAIIALALLIRSILPGIVPGVFESGSKPVPVATPSGLVDFISDPPGAAVRVDGEWLEGKTPLTGVALAPGLRRIELDWGPSGVWRDTLEVTSGARLVARAAIFGAVSFRSSDPARSLDVYVDGTYAGTTPLTLDRVVVGRHLVRFGGPGASSTTQTIEVLRDAPAEVIGNAGPIPETGRLTVRSAILTDAGFEPGRNDPIWIDGVARGASPLSLSLKPGSHSVRVVRRNYPAQVTVVDVKAGGEHYVTAEFGARSEQPLQLVPPDAISIKNPLPVTISMTSEEWDPSIALWLYAAAPDGSFQAKRMTKLEGGDRVFATVVPPEVLRNSARRVRLYVKATSTAGRELYSEIVTVPIRD